MGNGGDSWELPHWELPLSPTSLGRRPHQGFISFWIDPWCTITCTCASDGTPRVAPEAYKPLVGAPPKRCGTQWHLVVLRRLEIASLVRGLAFNKVSIWVQVHNIPVSYLNRGVAEDLCKVIGKLDRTSTNAEVEGGSFIKVRVQVNVSLPHCAGLVLLIEDGKEGFYKSRKKAGSKIKISEVQKPAPLSGVNLIKSTPVGQILDKEIADFGEHIVGNSSASESTISKTASFSNVENPVNHRDLLNSRILEIDRKLNKLDISEGRENGEIAKTNLDKERLEEIQGCLNLGGLIKVSHEVRGGGIVIFWKKDVDFSLGTISLNHIDGILNKGKEDEWRFMGFYGEFDTTLPLVEARRIKAIPLCVSRQVDGIIWPRCKNGEYLVKTGYQQLCEDEVSQKQGERLNECAWLLTESLKQHVATYRNSSRSFQCTQLNHYRGGGSWGFSCKKGSSVYCGIGIQQSVFESDSEMVCNAVKSADFDHSSISQFVKDVSFVWMEHVPPDISKFVVSDSSAS
ncbi:hypothetical protein SO802_006089 [Lithocarpus litseifolius]|uniref:DUF4283 domain-containing protein n=1 Tax=Lithocarpus litseifolius TaxID=425828 RepID=A0AAW2DPN8_9ROSI